MQGANRKKEKGDSKEAKQEQEEKNNMMDDYGIAKFYVRKTLTQGINNVVSYEITLAEKATKILTPGFDTELAELIKKHINQHIQLP